MTFLLFIGKSKLQLFDMQKDCARVTVNGKDYFAYDLTKAQDQLTGFINNLARDYKLTSLDEVKFQVITNPDYGVTSVILRALARHVKQKIEAMTIIKKALDKLSQNAELLIEQYGINYDGNCYKADLQKRDFSLLAYTLNDKELVDLIVHDDIKVSDDGKASTKIAVRRNTNGSAN